MPTTSAASERTAIAQSHKRRLRREQGSLCCEACAWVPPGGHWEVLNVHHVLPVSCGGSHEAGNFVLLCPNCHAVAHAVFPRVKGRYHGPTDKAGLMWAIRHPEAAAREAQGRVTNVLAGLLE